MSEPMMTREDFIQRWQYGYSSMVEQFTADLDALLAAQRDRFYAEVCGLAEQKMLKTNRMEGAHYAAMKELLGK